MNKLRGFTLIELMVVVVIVGLLAAFAWPQYQQFVRKARASDAQADLLELVSFVERQYTANNGYLKATGGAILTTTDLPFDDSARGGGSVFYDYTLVVNAEGTTFILTANPTDGSGQDKYKGCGASNTNMTIDEIGRTLPASGCWK